MFDAWKGVHPVLSVSIGDKYDWRKNDYWVYEKAGEIVKCIDWTISKGRLNGIIEGTKGSVFCGKYFCGRL